MTIDSDSYLSSIHEFTQRHNLIFSMRYHQGWKVELKDNEGERYWGKHEDLDTAVRHACKAYIRHAQTT